jgi:phospholipase/lecithinase/hemolysin
MAANWMRRTVLTAVAGASVAMLAACGSSSTANSIRPDSIITFGDAMTDLGQNPNGRPYSVSNGSYNNWTREIAYRYDLTITAAKDGGTAYAYGNARVSQPDATGVTNAPSITLEAATTAFNNGLLNALYGLSGTEVLYADVQYYFNSMTGNPGSYSFTNSTDPACTTADATNGLNIGVNQINSSLCTADTLVEASKVDQYLFSDLVNYTPQAHRRFGDWVYDRMKANW